MNMEDTITKKLCIILMILMAGCFGAAALAEDEPAEHNDSHQTIDRMHGDPSIMNANNPDGHIVWTNYDLYCLDCQRVIEENYKTSETLEPHAWTAERTAPTCEEDGLEIKTCGLCGAELQEVLPRLGHRYLNVSYLSGHGAGAVIGTGEFAGKVIGEVITPPTCQESGTGTLRCVRCQEAEQSVSIATTGHMWGPWEDVTVPPELVCVTDAQAVRRCSVCGEEETKTVAPAAGHQWQKDSVMEPTCVDEGTTVMKCSVCHTEKTESIPALGHTFCSPELFIKQPAGDVRGSGQYAGKIIGQIISASNCMETGRGLAVCLRCQKATQEVTIPIGEHRWTEWETVEIPENEICVTDVTGVHHCLDCGVEETQVLEKAKGHQWTAVSYSPPTCTEPGLAVRRCTVCGSEETIESPAMGHCYMWIESPANPSGGTRISEYKCTVCGDVKETKTIRDSVMYYNNTITSFGPTLRELIGGRLWNRVTPLDLAEEGIFTYPLIASNLYTVGTATVVNDQGVQQITYKLNSGRIIVHAESLVIYPDLESLTTGENAVSFSFDTPIVLSDYFGEDTQVIMAITLKADYDAKGAGILDFRVDQEQIDAMKQMMGIGEEN